jgi:hypothetical protein
MAVGWQSSTADGYVSLLRFVTPTPLTLPRARNGCGAFFVVVFSDLRSPVETGDDKAGNKCPQSAADFAQMGIRVERAQGTGVRVDSPPITNAA